MKIKDDFNNIIEAVAVPPFGTVEIKLKLIYKEPQLIATLNVSNHTLYFKRHPTKYFHRGLLGYGFSHELIYSDKFPYSNIVLTIGKKKYSFSREFIQANCIIQNQRPGFESQVYLSKKLILKNPLK